MNLPVSLFLPKRNIISWLKNKRVFAEQALVKQHVNTQAVFSPAQRANVQNGPKALIFSLQMIIKPVVHVLNQAVVHKKTESLAMTIQSFGGIHSVARHIPFAQEKNTLFSG